MDKIMLDILNPTIPTGGLAMRLMVCFLSSGTITMDQNRSIFEAVQYQRGIAQGSEAVYSIFCAAVSRMREPTEPDLQIVRRASEPRWGPRLVDDNGEIRGIDWYADDKDLINDRGWAKDIAMICKAFNVGQMGAEEVRLGGGWQVHSHYSVARLAHVFSLSERLSEGSARGV